MFDRVQEALDAAGGPVDFFFRDDDVGWGTDRLWPLLDVFARHNLPIDLAVIPTELTRPSARRLLTRTCSAPIRLHQHGFAHVNHEADGRKHEFGPSRQAERQRRDIAEGRRRLGDLLGPSVDPIFTPPWNRCTPETGRCLVALGFRVLSREARAAPLGILGLAELPVTVDWFAHHRRVRLTSGELDARAAAAIRDGRPVGVMFHHAAMDEDERVAAGALLGRIAGHPAARSVPMRLLACASRTAAGAP
jgi:peptidoglycan/xylan/chitin deacetylase (PgdA/CDA1 family)